MPTNTSVYNAGVNASNIYRINTSDNNRNANSSPSLQGNLPNESLVGLKDTFVKDKKKYGLVEKFYNFCKNKTGFGLGSNKVEQKIVDYENGKATEEEAKKKISDYKISQENSAQNFGDLTSAAVGIGGYIGLSNLAKKINARIKFKGL